MELYVEKMKGLSPLEKLSSGYSYVEDAEGRNVRSVTQVHEGDRLNVNVKDGKIQVEVKGTSEGKKRKNYVWKRILINWKSSLKYCLMLTFLSRMPSAPIARA